MAIRVLHLLHNLKREGAQVVVRNLLQNLDCSVCTPLVCGWKASGDLAEELRAAGVAVIETPTSVRKNAIALPGFLHRLIQRQQIALIHGHMSDSAIWAALAARRAGIPWVITHHSNRLIPAMHPFKRQIRLQLLQWAARNASINIAVAADVADQVQAVLGLAEEAVCIIVNGVKIPALIGPPPAQPLANHSYHLVAVGRLVEIKGHEWLIRAAAALRPKFPGLRVSIAGEGERRPWLEKLIRSENLEGCVNLLGLVSDIPGLLAQADLFVSTSSHEGLPISMLEAMAVGVPVVASDVPGNRTLVEDSVTGRCYPFGNSERLTEIIANLLANPQVRHDLAVTAHALVERSYSIRAMTQAHESIYQQVVAGDKP